MTWIVAERRRSGRASLARFGLTLTLLMVRGVHAELLVDLEPGEDHRNLGKILGRAVGGLVDQVRKRKLAETSAPRAEGTPSRATPSRHIPAAIRRAVAQRDGERCSYVGSNGRRCGTREFLEFDHRAPWARNRVHSVDGIRLRCRAHNQHTADRDFGQPHMDRCRGRSGKRASGPPERRPLPGQAANWI